MSNIVMKDEVGDILVSLARARAQNDPPYYEALAAVALALGLRGVADEIDTFAGQVSGRRPKLHPVIREARPKRLRRSY